MNDATALADCYIAEHTADDGEAVTEKWLRSVGFTIRTLPHCFSVRGGVGEDIAVDVTLPEEGMEEADSLWVQGELAVIEPTRGHVRRLCSALGIALKEPAPCST